MLKKVLGKKVNKREEPTSPGNTPAAGADRHAALFGACQEVSLSADDARCHCDLVLARVHAFTCMQAAPVAAPVPSVTISADPGSKSSSSSGTRARLYQSHHAFRPDRICPELADGAP